MTDLRQCYVEPKGNLALILIIDDEAADGDELIDPLAGSRVLDQLMPKIAGFELKFSRL